MTLRLGEVAPDFEADTTQGRIRFHDWLGDGWAVLFSHPKNYTPVCTTELGYMAKIKSEFDRRGVKIIGLSVDPVAQHAGWADRHRGHAGRRTELSAHRRRRFRGGEAVRHAAREHERRSGAAHRGRQPDSAQRVRDRAGQDGSNSSWFIR